VVPLIMRGGQPCGVSGIPHYTKEVQPCTWSERFTLLIFSCSRIAGTRDTSSRKARYVQRILGKNFCSSNDLSLTKRLSRTINRDRSIYVGFFPLCKPLTLVTISCRERTPMNSTPTVSSTSKMDFVRLSLIPEMVRPFIICY
jgi:hypothetical protein